jgi:hypothetical protein
MLNIGADVNESAVVALDGDVGHVTDVLIHDQSWTIKWVVVTNQMSVPNPLILLPPSVLGPLDPSRRHFNVKLTKMGIRNSSDVDSEFSLSRQLEIDTSEYYDWLPYWIAGGDSLGSDLQSHMKAEGHDEFEGENRHLHSGRAITGYHIRAKDGEIGHVDGFLMDEADWSLRYLIVALANWLPGKKTLISPSCVIDIDRSKREISIDIDREEVKNSPPYDAASRVSRAATSQCDIFYADVGPRAN